MSDRLTLNLCPSSLGTCRSPGCHRPTSHVYFRPYEAPPVGMKNGPCTIPLCGRCAAEWRALETPPDWIGDGLLVAWDQREPEAAGVLQAPVSVTPIVVATDKPPMVAEMSLFA